MTEKDVQRFERKFSRTDGGGCWLWTGSRDVDGYGRFRLGRLPAMAHRVPWLFYRGEFPPGMHVMHACDTPACVNPDHLRLGSHIDNMREKMERGRRGIQPKYQRVDPAMADAIRRASATVPVRQIARDLGIDPNTVRRWRDKP